MTELEIIQRRREIVEEMQSLHEVLMNTPNLKEKNKILDKMQSLSSQLSELRSKQDD